MWPVIPLSVAAALFGLAIVLTLFATHVVAPNVGRNPRVRVVLLVAFAPLAIGLVLWWLGARLSEHGVAYRGSTLLQGGLIVLLPAALVAPFAAWTARAFAEVATSAPTASSAPRVALTRRDVLRFGNASLPAVAALGSASGLVSARSAPRFPVIRMRYPNLHPDLCGLRILQVSDVHLGASLSVEELASALADAQAQHRPDLVVVTGDLADYNGFIPEALRHVAELAPRYGAYAVLGNHEYIHDVAETRPLFEKSPVRLLVGDGVTVLVGRAKLFVGGADDPFAMDGDIARLVAPTIEAAARLAPSDADFRLLLCHRPEGHGPAAKHGFDLTLAGHTHGGQIGLLGRSIFERLDPSIGWWGSYEKEGAHGPSRLYTTSGAGHWLPFRIGCPTEMPIIVLEAEPFDMRRS